MIKFINENSYKLSYSVIVRIPHFIEYLSRKLLVLTIVNADVKGTLLNFFNPFSANATYFAEGKMVWVNILYYLFDLLSAFRTPSVRISTKSLLVNHDSVFATVWANSSETSFALMLLPEDSKLFATHLAVLLGPSLNDSIVFIEKGERHDLGKSPIF